MLGCSDRRHHVDGARLRVAVQEREVRHVVGHDAPDAGRAQRGFPVGRGAGGEHRRQLLLELDAVLGARGDGREPRVGGEVVASGCRGRAG